MINVSDRLCFQFAHVRDDDHPGGALHDAGKVQQRGAVGRERSLRRILQGEVY